MAKRAKKNEAIYIGGTRFRCCVCGTVEGNIEGVAINMVPGHRDGTVFAPCCSMKCSMEALAKYTGKHLP